MVKNTVIVKKGHTTVLSGVLATAEDRGSHKASVLGLPRGMSWKTEPIGISDIPREYALQLKKGKNIFINTRCIKSPGGDFIRLSAEQGEDDDRNSRSQILLVVQKNKLHSISYNLEIIFRAEVRGGEVIILEHSNHSLDQEVWVTIGAKKTTTTYFRIIEGELSRGYSIQKREDQLNGILL